MADELNQYLEGLNENAHERELDQEEHIVKSLPFFAAVLGIAATIAVRILDSLPPLQPKFWAMATLALLGAAGLVFGWVMILLVQLIRRSNLLIPSNEVRMLSWSDELVAFHKRASLTEAAARKAALDTIRRLMIDDYARCTVHNRRLNDKKLSCRAQGFIWLVVLIFLVAAAATTLAAWKSSYPA